jgi:hypothetical protein
LLPPITIQLFDPAAMAQVVAPTQPPPSTTNKKSAAGSWFRTAGWCACPRRPSETAPYREPRLLRRVGSACSASPAKASDAVYGGPADRVVDVLSEKVGELLIAPPCPMSRAS